MGPYTDYIISAFGISLLVIAINLAWYSYQYRRQLRLAKQQQDHN